MFVGMSNMREETYTARHDKSSKYIFVIQLTAGYWFGLYWL